MSSSSESISFSLNESTLHMFSMHKLRVNSREIQAIGAEKSASSLQALAIWVDQIVTNSNAKASSMHFDEIPMPEAFWPLHDCHQFHIRIYNSRTPKTDRIGQFLRHFGAEGDFGETSSVHYLFFFYRELIRSSEHGKSVIDETLPEVFALTSNQAWQALSRRDFKFPIQIFQRVASANHIKRETARELAGKVEMVEVHFKNSPSALATDHLYHIITNVQSQLRKRAFMRSCTGIATKRGPTKAQISIEMGNGSIKVGRQIPLPAYAELFDYFSGVVRGEQMPSINRVTNRLVKLPLESDNPKLDFLHLIHPVDFELAHDLEEMRKELIWQMFQGKSAPSLYFQHRYTKDFYASSLTPRYQKKLILPDPHFWDYLPTLEEVIALMRTIPELKNSGTNKAFFERLRHFEISFLHGRQPKFFPFMEFVEGEVRTSDAKTYFFINGIWQEASVEYHVLLHRDFKTLLDESLLREGEEGNLEKRWMPKESWSGFTLKHMKEHLDDEKQASELLTQMSASQQCEEMRKKKGVYLMKEAVTLEKHKALEVFLNGRLELKSQKKAEGPYNETYLYDVMNEGKYYGPDTGWIPGDRIDHTGRKLEIFDIIFYTFDTCYIYAVKEGFGGTTGVACRQVRDSKKEFEQFRNANSTSTVVREFWDEVINSNEEGYRAKLKGQLEHLGWEAFRDIFTTRDLVFVYAFIDSEGEKERLLENESQGVENLKLTAKDFNKPVCLNMRNKPNTTPQEIMGMLERHEYLKDGKPTDKLLVCSRDQFALDRKLGKTTQRPAIYNTLMEKIAPLISQFDTTIAKIELINLYKEMNGKFEFRISQIRRPEGAIGYTASQASPPRRLTQSTQQAITPQLGFAASRQFEFEGVAYRRENTRGFGSCALHALLGVKQGNQFVYAEGEGNPDLAAKKAFQTRLEEGETAAIRDLMRQNLTALYHEAVNQRGAAIDRSIFFDCGEVEALGVTMREGQEDLTHQLEALRQEEGELWGQLVPENLEYEDLLSQNDHVYEEGATPATQLADWVNEDFNSFQELLLADENEEVRNQILAIREQRQNLVTQRDQLLYDYVESEAVRARYLEIFLKKEYYLHSLEIQVAALLFNKGVTVLHYNPHKEVERFEEDFNMNAPERVVLFHQGDHFERCTEINL